MATAFRARSCSSGRWMISSKPSAICTSTRTSYSTAVATPPTRPAVRRSIATSQEVPWIFQRPLNPHECSSKRSTLSLQSMEVHTKGSRTRSSRRQCIVTVSKPLYSCYPREPTVVCSRAFFSADRKANPSARFYSTSTSAASAPKNLTREQRIRGMSNRIVHLPQWRDQPRRTSTLDTLSSSNFTARPVHPRLLGIWQQFQERRDMASHSSSPASALEGVLNVCVSYPRDLEIADFSFILETIQFYSASQQEFWESMSTLIRYSMPNQRMRGSAAAQDWQRTIAYAISEVFWKHQDAFVQQVERAQSRAPIPSGDLLGPQQPPNKLSDGEILAHTMIESLLATYYQSRALSLYAVLSERGVAMPGKLLESFIRIAVSQGDGAQLERIGNMILTHEEIYQESLTSTRSDTEVHNRPLLMSAKIMDSFVYGACGQQLYDLARAVFDRGLQAGQKYRTSTFTAILNSLSVKEFGFDVVAAAGASTKVDAKRHHARRRSMRGLGYTNHCEAGTAGLSTVTGTNASFSSSSTVSKKIAVTGPEKIEKYIQAMEDQKVKPSMTTLNVLVKLHLEMAQYRVPGAPHWKSVFRRYNPLRLQPDIVTNNTLLTFYEKRKDLAAMRKIYESMARVAEDADLKSKRARRLQRKILVEHGDIDPVTIDQDRVSEEHEYSPDRPHPQSRHVRSNRDIYTYNTMLHALLQHAVETKDIASIGQCFYDMEQDGISADTVTFNANILYHITRSDLSSAIQVFHSMKGANSPSESTLRSGPWNTESFLSTADSRSSRHSLSLSKPVKSLPSTVSMSRRSLSPIENSPKVAISPTAALDFVSTSPPAPDVVTLTALISGFAQAGRMDKASHFFKEMTDRHCIEPNLKTYAALVAGLHRTGDHERAERLWELVLDEEDAEIPEESGLKITKNSDHGSEQVGSEMNGGGSEIPGNDDIARRSQPRHLTIMERLQAETRRKLYRESLQA